MKDTEKLEFATVFECLEYCLKEYLFKCPRSKSIAESTENDLIWIVPHETEIDNLYSMFTGENEREDLIQVKTQKSKSCFLII